MTRQKKPAALKPSVPESAKDDDIFPGSAEGEGIRVNVARGGKGEVHRLSIGKKEPFMRSGGGGPS